MHTFWKIKTKGYILSTKRIPKTTPESHIDSASKHDDTDKTCINFKKKRKESQVSDGFKTYEAVN